MIAVTVAESTMVSVIVVAHLDRPLEARPGSAASGSIVDLMLLLVLGMIGFGMRRFGLPRDVRAEWLEAGVRFEARRLVRGADPADEVLGAAAETNAPLIVIGLYRRTPVGKVIMSSTSHSGSLLEADRPVLGGKADKAVS